MARYNRFGRDSLIFSSSVAPESVMYAKVKVLPAGVADEAAL